jgi:hypothetical protein
MNARSLAELHALIDIVEKADNVHRLAPLYSFKFHVRKSLSDRLDSSAASTEKKEAPTFRLVVKDLLFPVKLVSSQEYGAKETLNLHIEDQLEQLLVSAGIAVDSKKPTDKNLRANSPAAAMRARALRAYGKVGGAPNSTRQTRTPGEDWDLFDDDDDEKASSFVGRTNSNNNNSILGQMLREESSLPIANEFLEFLFGAVSSPLSSSSFSSSNRWRKRTGGMARQLDQDEASAAIAVASLFKSGRVLCTKRMGPAEPTLALRRFGQVCFAYHRALHLDHPVRRKKMMCSCNVRWCEV